MNKEEAKEMAAQIRRNERPENRPDPEEVTQRLIDGFELLDDEDDSTPCFWLGGHYA